MQIQISPRQIKLTEANQKFIEEKINHLLHFEEGILSAHVVIHHDETRSAKHAFVTKVQLNLAKSDLYAEDHGHDLYQAVDLVAMRLAEQLRHRKSKLVKGSRDVARKAKLRRQTTAS